MVTYDSDYLKLHGMKVEHARIVYIRPGSRNIGELIELLIIFHEIFLPNEMTNRLEYL